MFQILPGEFSNWAARLLLAQGIIILFLLLNVASFSMAHAGDFKPFFLLMAVYYWAIYRPTVMPPLYTFLLGLIMDLLAWTPVGSNALILLALQAIVQRSRVFLMGQPYIVVWLGFGLMAVANATSMWLIISLSSMSIAPLSAFTEAMIAACLSVLIFPLASIILHWVHKLLPVASKPLHSVG